MAGLDLGVKASYNSATWFDSGASRTGHGLESWASHRCRKRTPEGPMQEESLRLLEAVVDFNATADRPIELGRRA